MSPLHGLLIEQHAARMQEISRNTPTCCAGRSQILLKRQNGI
jgi:hypothetical protein